MIDTRTAPYAAFVLRAALGLMFIAHALLKYAVFTLPGTVKFFESLGLPGPLAYATFLAELVGGALILAGVMMGFGISGTGVTSLVGVVGAMVGLGTREKHTIIGRERNHYIQWMVLVLVQAVVPEQVQELVPGSELGQTWVSP